MRALPYRRRQLSLPIAAALAGFGTVLVVCSIAWAVKAVLNVG